MCSSDLEDAGAAQQHAPVLRDEGIEGAGFFGEDDVPVHHSIAQVAAAELDKRNGEDDGMGEHAACHFPNGEGGAVVAGGWAAGGISMLGVWLIMGHGGDTLRDGAHWLRFGSAAWRGRQQCAHCGHDFRSIAFRDRNSLGLFPSEGDGHVALISRCPKCGLYRDAGLHLTGDEADRTLRRVLAYHHYAGASERRVFKATRLIQEAGSPRDLTRIVLRDGRRLGDLQRTGGIALEIAANEATEQHLLELELAELEAHWRREEELAAIIDGELTPLPLLEQMRRRVTPG